MKRRLLAMALSLVMLVGLFPTAAMATDDPGGGNSSSVSADTSHANHVGSCLWRRYPLHQGYRPYLDG